MKPRSKIPRLAAPVLAMTALAALLSMFTPGSASATACVNPNDPLNPRIVVPPGFNVSLDHCTISGQSNPAGPGGGVENYGTLTLDTVTISDNTAGTDGGGIFNGSDGTLTLTNVVVTGNTAGGFGGGIHNAGGSITMSNVTVTDNTAGSGGGGIAHLGGSAVGTGLAVVNNTTTAGNGGGILNVGGTFCLSAGDSTTCSGSPGGGNSLVQLNTARTGNGGGIANDSGDLALGDSTVDGNQAGNGGGIWTQSDGNGGTVLFNATISNNTATGNGGGLFNDGGLVCCGFGVYAINLTISGNKAGGSGGGVYTTGHVEVDPFLGEIVVMGVALLNSSTIADNTATGSGGGVYNDDSVAGTPSEPFAATEVQNTLLARNGTNCAGTVQSDGNNLDTSNVCAFAASGDQHDVGDANVGLLGLEKNGGPPQGSSVTSIAMKTQALEPTSPAVDTGGGCAGFDERNIGRPAVGCDIGAYELVACLALEKTCAVVPPDSPFTCKAPIKTLQMEWAPGSMTDKKKWVLTDPAQVIDLKAFVGGVGGTPVSTQCDIDPGDIVTVTGLGSKPDSVWQVYQHVATCVPGNPATVTGTLLGQSKFHVGGCDDTAMNSVDDCGKFEGDGKDNRTGFINDWKLAGMTGSSATNGTLVCNQAPGSNEQNCVVPVGGGEVIYTYTVTNIGPTPVTNGILIDKVGSTTVAGPISFSLDVGESQTFDTSDDPTTITQNTTNVATATGTNGAGECSASDKATVNVACVLGYPFTSTNSRTSIVFGEPGVLRVFQPNFAGPNSPNNTIRLFYNDEHALTLGVRQVVVKTTTGTSTKPFTVTPLSTNPASTTDPLVGPTTLTGDLSGADPVGAPVYPAIFITDLTINGVDSKVGDWQSFGTAIPPHFVSGAWKSAVRTVDKTRTPTLITVTPDADPAKNNWTLASGSDPVPAGLTNEGYGAEVRWNVNGLHVNLNTGTGSTNTADPVLTDPVFAGHTFRVQFMVHDGDQNKTGGDVGQNCSIVTIPESQ